MPISTLAVQVQLVLLAIQIQTPASIAIFLGNREMP